MKSRYAGLQACWMITVHIHESGSVTGTLGKLDLVTKWMRFSPLSEDAWEGDPEAAAAYALIKAAREVHLDAEDQLRLF